MNGYEKMLVANIEKYSFGVCSYFAEKWHLNITKVRLYFVYSSFVAFGSPIIFYLFTAFWLNVRKYLRTGNSLFN